MVCLQQRPAVKVSFFGKLSGFIETCNLIKWNGYARFAPEKPTNTRSRSLSGIGARTRRFKPNFRVLFLLPTRLINTADRMP